jgi:hypothetical protein
MAVRKEVSPSAEQGAPIPELISVLLIEDNLPDARLVQELLRESPDPGFEVSCVAQLSEAVSELGELSSRSSAKVPTRPSPPSSPIGSSVP